MASVIAEITTKTDGQLRLALVRFGLFLVV